MKFTFNFDFPKLLLIESRGDERINVENVERQEKLRTLFFSLSVPPAGISSGCLRSLGPGETLVFTGERDLSASREHGKCRSRSTSFWFARDGREGLQRVERLFRVRATHRSTDCLSSPPPPLYTDVRRSRKDDSLSK